MPEHVCILLTRVFVISFLSGVRLIDYIKMEYSHWIAESSGMMIFQLISMKIIYIS